MWTALVDRHATRAADPWDLDEEIVPLSLVDRVCGPAGLVGEIERVLAAAAVGPVAEAAVVHFSRRF